MCSFPLLGQGLFCFVLFLRLVSFLLHVSWQALISVAIGQRECSGAAKKGGDSGLANPRMNGAPSSLSPVSVQEPRGATSPRLSFPTSCVMSLPNASTSLSCSRQPCPHPILQNRYLEVGSQVGKSPLGGQSPQVLVPVSVPGTWHTQPTQRLMAERHLTLDLSLRSPP